VANYNVDLEIAVRGAKELQKTRVGVKQLQREIRKFNKEAQQGTKVVKNFHNLEEVVGRSKAALNTAAIGTSKFDKAVKALAKSELTYSKEMANRNRALENAKRAQLGMQSIEEREHQLLMRGNKLRDLRMRKEKALGKMNRFSGGMSMRQRLTGATGSAIIGGGFPLLFGQGPTAAIGGALGGAAGGMIGGQFGFALSIAGTTIGSALDNLANALAKPTENIQLLVDKVGLANTPTGDLALRLEKLGLKSTAANLVLAEFNKKFGKTPEDIKRNTEQMTKFKNQINELGTAITLMLSKVLGPTIKSLLSFIDRQSLANKVGRFNLASLEMKATNEAARLTKEEFGFSLGAVAGPLAGPGVEDFFKKTEKELKEKFITEALNKKRIEKGLAPIDPNKDQLSFNQEFEKAQKIAQEAEFNKNIRSLEQSLQLEKDRLNISSEQFTIKQEEFKLDNLRNDLKLLELDYGTELTDEELNNLNILKAKINLQEQVLDNARALIDPFRQVSNIIAQDIGDGIKGLIRGTETLGGLLNNVLNKMADAFLNLAIFGNIGGTFERGGGGLLGSIFKANGGPVKGGNSYIVGERGPEMFTPGVSGSITPNHQLGGSTNVVVNVDASGSAVEGDEDRGRELGRLISVAVQSELVQQKRPGGLLA
tara:strand:- start:496 stop:2457 length:1962 start_codon:yes stop_codon:yes gene_type:complete